MTESMKSSSDLSSWNTRQVWLCCIQRRELGSETPIHLNRHGTYERPDINFLGFDYTCLIEFLFSHIVTSPPAHMLRGSFVGVCLLWLGSGVRTFVRVCVGVGVLVQRD